jgi:hypothetical protein
MAYNFKNDLDYKTTINAEFVINVPKFDGQTFNVKAYVIDDDCNYFDEWEQDRKTHNITNDCFAWSPQDPQIDNPTTLKNAEKRELYFNELYPKYTEASELEPIYTTATVEAGKLILNTDLAPHAVVFYEITPQG